MSIIASLTLIEFKPQNANGRIHIRRRKLVEKIDQQIKLASDPNYAPCKVVWVKDESGVEQRREIPKRVKRWWVNNVDGTVQLTIRYGSKALELAKGKSAIECAVAGEVGPTLQKVKDAVLSGELDPMLDKQVGPVRKIKSAV